MMKTRGMTNRRRIAALDFDSLNPPIRHPAKKFLLTETQGIGGRIILIKLD